MPRTSPDLIFGPGSNSGFTPAGIAAFDDLRPAAVVRELIQNALDAARIAGTKPAVVCFRLSSVHRRRIPGMRSYEKAIGRAVRSQREMMQGELAPQAELVWDRISDVLAQDRVDVLSILDNGIGLNEQRMNALLSDGLSVKGGGATGTYGNGHSTAIPASDLRYVLYGGLTTGGNRIAAGHAVLASQYVEGDEHLRGGDGFFILGFRPGKGTLYDYPSGDKIPKLIASDLNRIRRTNKHGTAVIIPAFNYFLEKSDLWDIVSHAASANFFVAIDEGELEVNVEDARKRGALERWSLDRSSLSDVLETHREKQRSSSFLSGRKAFEAHRTFRAGNRHQLTTSEGTFEIRFADNPSGAIRFDLCRNGMWITDRLPGFYGKFPDRVPFHAVLSLKAEDGGRLHDFVRTAEGPLHDTLVAKRLPTRDRNSFYRVMSEIVDWIREHTPAVRSEAYTSDDFLTLDFGTDGRSGNGRKGTTFWGAPVVIGRRPAQQLRSFQDEFQFRGGKTSNGSGKKKSSSPASKSRSRPALPALFQAASCPVGNGRRRIQIEFPKECQDAQMRLLVDEGLDATCDRHGQDQYTPVVLDNVMIDGSAATKADLELWNDKAVGVRFGDVAEGSTVTVEADFMVVGDFAGLPNPSLRIEVFRTLKDVPPMPGTGAPNQVGEK